MTDENRDAPRTIYTLTLLDILVSAAEKHKDKELRHALREVSERGFRKAEILAYANDHLKPEARRHLQRIVDSMSARERKAV